MCYQCDRKQENRSYFTGADLERVHKALEPCQRFQIYQIKGLETGKFIDFLEDWNPVTVFMTGFKNKTDSLFFFVNQLGCFIDLKINAGTKRCGRVGVTPAADMCN